MTYLVLPRVGQQAGHGGGVVELGAGPARHHGLALRVAQHRRAFALLAGLLGPRPAIITRSHSILKRKHEIAILILTSPWRLSSSA